MVNCPKCGKDAKSPNKDWNYSIFKVKLYKCSNCGTSFKAYFKEGKLSHTIPKK